jgi:hypothetical protein
MSTGAASVSSEMLFALSIAVKMIVTALFFVGATFAAERGGPVVGGMVATLPISAGPAYVFLALDHDAAFLATAALASFVATAATCLAALAFAVAAQRRGPAASFAAGFLVWLAVIALLQARPWTMTSAWPLVAVVFSVSLVLVDPYRRAARPILVRRWYDVPLRASMVAILVALVIILSVSLGPALTGFAACFPIVLMSLMAILHPRLGGPAAAAVLANSMLGLLGFAMFCLTLYAVVEWTGAAAGLLLAVAVNAACNLGFWALRRHGVRD